MSLCTEDKIGHDIVDNNFAKGCENPDVDIFFSSVSFTPFQLKIYSIKASTCRWGLEFK